MFGRVNAAAKQAPKQRRPLTILIADDERDTVMTLAAVLEDEGHVVHTVTNGRLVTEAMRQFNPEVCIFDIEMPGQSGYDLATEISARPKAIRPLLIGISGVWKSSTDILLAKAVGFDHFFAKPADPAELIAVLEPLREKPPAA